VHFPCPLHALGHSALTEFKAPVAKVKAIMLDFIGEEMEEGGEERSEDPTRGREIMKRNETLQRSRYTIFKRHFTGSSRDKLKIASELYQPIRGEAADQQK
jgi:hypothetical protein